MPAAGGKGYFFIKGVKEDATGVIQDGVKCDFKEVL